MKLFRGFKGKYFSLAAILACSAGVSLEANNVSLETIDHEISRAQTGDKEAETEAEEVALSTISVISVKKSYEQTSSRSLTTHTTDSVQIITSEEIEAQGFQTLGEVLNNIAGISSTANGGAGQSASVYLRGFNAAHTLVLIDGVRLNDVSGLSGAQTELIDLWGIERIEIVKGSQSGVWGSDASAGVINIITKRIPLGFSGNALAEGGSNSWQKYALSLAYADEIFDLSLAYSFADTKGISAAAPKKGQSGYGDRDLGWEKDGFNSKTIYLKGGVNLTPSDRLELFIRNNRSKNHFDGGAGVDANDYDDLYGWGVDKYFNTIKTSIYSLGYAGTWAKHKINARANLSDFERSFYDGYRGKTYEAYLSDEFAYLDGGELIFGAGYLKDEVKRSAGATLPNDSQDDKHIFATNSNQFGDFLVSESLRFDARDTFDDKLTGKFGVKYNFYGDFFISASYKTGYLAPNLYQQNYGATSDLQAEETKGYEVTLGHKNFSLTYFDARVKNSIEYGGVWPLDLYENIDGESKFRGVEATITGLFSEAFLGELSYTYLSAKDANGEKIARRPKEKVTGSLTWFAPYSVSMNLRGVYVGERFDSAGGTQTGKYFTTDYTLNYDINSDLGVYVKAQNIFDKYYQEVDGYGTLGRSFYVGIRGGF